MAFSSSFRPNTVLSPFSDPTRTTTSNLIYPFLRRTLFGNLSNHKPFLRSNLTVARFGLGRVQLPDAGITEWLTGNLVTRPEGLVYSIADASVSVSPESSMYTKPSYDWLSECTLYTNTVLEVLKKRLSTVHIPYAYGFAIILFAVLVNAATFPLKKKSIEVSMAMKYLGPLVNAILRRDTLDSEESLDEVDRLYEQFGINPWSVITDALRSLAWIGVTTGLYKKLSDFADRGLLTEDFFWIPSLSGPTTIATRQSDSLTCWFFPFVDGQPPLGWLGTLAYLVLPALVSITKYLGYKLRHPEELKKCECPDCEDSLGFETFSEVTNVFWPVMFGSISLFVPSGLSLYWVTDNILDDLQAEWLVKRGAKNPLKDLHYNVSLIKPIQEKPTSYGPRPGDSYRSERPRDSKKMKTEKKMKWRLLKKLK